MLLFDRYILYSIRLILFWYRYSIALSLVISTIGYRALYDYFHWYEFVVYSHSFSDVYLCCFCPSFRPVLLRSKCLLAIRVLTKAGCPFIILNNGTVMKLINIHVVVSVPPYACCNRFFIHRVRSVLVN